MTLSTVGRRPSRFVPGVECLEGRDVLAPLIPGGVTSGEVTAAGQLVPMTFSASAGDVVELITTSTPSQPGFTAFVDLYAPSGTRVTGFFPGSNTILTLTETGTYSATVRDDNNKETGTFTVGIEGLKPISPNPRTVVKGGITAGAVNLRTGKNQLIFAGTAGDRVELISTSTPTQPGFTAFVDVYGPSGTRVTGFFPGTNVVLDLNETGNYMLQVRDDNYTETGKFTIGLESLKPISPAPVTLTKGAIASGDLLEPTEKDQIIFAGQAGQRIELVSTSTATQAGFTAFVDVYGPSGTRVTGFFPGTNVVLDLNETGNYMLQVRDDNYAQTGKYTIGLEGLKPFSPDARPLPLGTVAPGSIAKPIRKDQWTVNVPAGKRLQVTLVSTATDPDFQAFANVYGSSGTRVGGMFPGTQTFNVTEPGVQMIQVNDVRLSRRGNYTLRVQLV